MPIAAVNTAAIQNAPGYLYLLPTPTTMVAVTTLLQVKETFANFYADGDIRLALKGGIVPWATVTKDGFKDKPKAKPLMVEPNVGGDYIGGYEAIDYSAEFTIMESDVQHLKDLMSASALQVQATVASATQAGRDTFIGGGQRFPTDYMLLYRFPSKQVPGEYRNVLVPACNVEIDFDRERSRGKLSELKVKVIAKDFALLPDPTTGLPTKWLEDYVTNPHS